MHKVIYPGARLSISGQLFHRIKPQNPCWDKASRFPSFAFTAHIYLSGQSGNFTQNTRKKLANPPGEMGDTGFFR